MRIGILISSDSWFLDYFKRHRFEYEYTLFTEHKELPKEDNELDVLFILSYFKIIPPDYLKCAKKNLVVHESELPKGRGWAPYFWQILEGKSDVPICLIEATEQVDSGNILIQDTIQLNGTELHSELREKQATKTLELCGQYIENHENIIAVAQKGSPTFYKKRTPRDSELDINKTLKEQFNLLRIVDNEAYPAFFEYMGKKYVIRIEEIR